VGPVGLAGLGEVGLVAAPAHAAFDAVAGVGVIGAVDGQRGGWQLPFAAPAQPVPVAVVVLDPHRPQGLHRWDLPQPHRRVGGVDGIQQREPVSADHHGERGAGCCGLREPVVAGALAVALVPVLGNHREQPAWCCGGQGFQRCPQRLDDQLQPVELAHRRHYTGGIGALPATLYQQPLHPQALQQPLQQLLRRIIVDQPGAELAQHRGVKPRVGQLQVQRVLPVDPAADRVGGLAVRQAFDKLQHQHQRQPRR
jgi:hypothetical protein